MPFFEENEIQSRENTFQQVVRKEKLKQFLHETTLIKSSNHFTRKLITAIIQITGIISKNLCLPSGWNDYPNLLDGRG